VPKIGIRLLGRFAVRVSGREVPERDFGGRHTRALVRMLACRRGTLVSKDEIAEALWGETQPASPAANVDVLASRARRVLGNPTLLVGRSGGLILSPSEDIAVDAEAVEASVTQGRHYLSAERWAEALAAFQEGLAAWGGEPLAEDAYAEWAQPVRRELEGLHLEALEGGTQAALRLRDWTVAVGLARGAVAAEPLREASALLLASALARSGDQAAALEAFHRYRRALADELGLDPSPEAFELQDRILHGMQPEGLVVLADVVPSDARAMGSRVLSGRGSAPMRARTLASMAMLAAGSDDYRRASELVDTALADAGDDPRALAEVLYIGSIIDMNLGLLDRAATRAREALAHFEGLGDAHGVANILDGEAMATFMAGHITEAAAAFERVARLFEESRDRPRVVTPRSTRGHALVFMDRSEEGLIETERALGLAAELEDRGGEAYAGWHLSEALADLGRADDAVDAAEAALSIAEELEHREWTAATLRGLGIARRAGGDLPAAEEAFRRGVEVAEGIPLFATWHAAQLGLVLIEDGRAGEAEGLVRGALAGGPPLGRFEARLAEVRLAEATGGPEAEPLREALRADAAREGHLQLVKLLG
jgi:DNA-binding SARP family transcriptional activator